MSFDLILSRLEKVKRTPNGFMACCPAHQDQTPSLSLREADGKILLHCWVGCSAVEIVESIGLTINDLFEAPLAHHKPRERLPFTSREAMEALSIEIQLVSLLAADLSKGRTINEADRKRLAIANSRLMAAHAYCNGL